jgi:hypothetical protein
MDLRRRDVADTGAYGSGRRVDGLWTEAGAGYRWTRIVGGVSLAKGGVRECRDEVIEVQAN